jgi:hypothetical protein
MLLCEDFYRNYIHNFLLFAKFLLFLILSMTGYFCLVSLYLIGNAFCFAKHSDMQGQIKIILHILGIMNV